MTINKELLEFTRDFIEKYPEKHKQNLWISDNVDQDEHGRSIVSAYEANSNVCKTRGCVAGWAALFAGYHQLRDECDYIVDETGLVQHIEFGARNALGLTGVQGAYLFESENSRETLFVMIKALLADDNADLSIFLNGDRVENSLHGEIILSWRN